MFSAPSHRRTVVNPWSHTHFRLIRVRVRRYTSSSFPRRGRPPEGFEISKRTYEQCRRLRMYRVGNLPEHVKTDARHAGCENPSFFFFSLCVWHVTALAATPCRPRAPLEREPTTAPACALDGHFTSLTTAAVVVSCVFLFYDISVNYNCFCLPTIADAPHKKPTPSHSNRSPFSDTFTYMP